MGGMVTLSFVLVCTLLLYSQNFPIVSDAASAGRNTNTLAAIPIIAKKAGGSWKPDAENVSIQVEKEESNIKGKIHTTEDESYLDSEEVECPSRYFFHIRGRKCVPLRCLGGNKFRDQETGDCEEDKSGCRSFWVNGRRQLKRIDNGRKEARVPMYRFTRMGGKKG